MSHTQGAQDGPVRVAQASSDGHRRRWYHLRPDPRHRSDVMGVNRVWWTALWLIVIVVLVEPWWW